MREKWEQNTAANVLHIIIHFSTIKEDQKKRKKKSMHNIFLDVSFVFRSVTAIRYEMKEKMKRKFFVGKKVARNGEIFFSFFFYNLCNSFSFLPAAKKRETHTQRGGAHDSRFNFHDISSENDSESGHTTTKMFSYFI